MNLLWTFFAVLSFASGDTPSRWSGVYRQTSGIHDLYIDQFDSKGLSLDLVKKGQSVDTHTRNDMRLVAIINGDVAVVPDEEDCEVKLKLTQVGIELSDLCGGPHDQGGLYKRINSKQLETDKKVSKVK